MIVLLSIGELNMVFMSIVGFNVLELYATAVGAAVVRVAASPYPA